MKRMEYIKIFHCISGATTVILFVHGNNLNLKATIISLTIFSRSVHSSHSSLLSNNRALKLLRHVIDLQCIVGSVYGKKVGLSQKISYKFTAYTVYDRKVIPVFGFATETVLFQLKAEFITYPPMVRLLPSGSENESNLMARN